MADAQMIERTVKKAFAAAGLRPYTPHSFRHMHAKLADDVTASVGLARAISRNLGHSTPKVTYASYGTQSPEQRRDLIRDHFQPGRKLPPDNLARAELRAVFHALKPMFDEPSD